MSVTEHLRLVGMLVSKGDVKHRQDLHSKNDIVAFLKTNLFPEWDGVSTDQVVIVEADSERPVFNAIGGVDLDSELQIYGMDLPSIYREINRQQSEALSQLSRESDRESGEEEDSIGLSAKEMIMRKETLRSARAAQTVGDVAKLVQGTYFDAWFETSDRSKSWGYFEHGDFSVQPMRLEGGGWSSNDSEGRVTLDKNARVRFDGSGEDIVSFVILDPPA